LKSETADKKDFPGERSCPWSLGLAGDFLGIMGMLFDRKIEKNFIRDIKTVMFHTYDVMQM
jgi:hypothetical protein